ncbi:hypothetical protein BDR26DRAFT_837901, partial [Obelidium mucronatum]
MRKELSRMKQIESQLDEKTYSLSHAGDSSSSISSSQDTTISSSESLYGHMNLNPYYELESIPSIGPEKAKEFVDIVIKVSRSTTIQNLRQNVMKSVTMKGKFLDVCGVLERAQVLDVLYKGNHDPVNEPHIRYFSEMGKKEIPKSKASVESPSKDHEAKRIHFLSQLQSCKESFLSIPALLGCSAWIDQFLDQFAELRLSAENSEEYETNFVV